MGTGLRTFCTGFELFWANTTEMAMTTRSIVEPVDIFGYILELTRFRGHLTVIAEGDVTPLFRMSLQLE